MASWGRAEASPAGSWAGGERGSPAGVEAEKLQLSPVPFSLQPSS